MNVALRQYDFAAARARQIARVDRDKRLVHDARGEVDFYRTRELRDLREGVSDTLLFLEMTLVRALSELPIEEGGLRADGTVRTSALSADMPLVKALLILAAHPMYGPRLVGDALPGSGPFFARQPRLPWRLDALEDAVREGVVGVYGDVTVSPDRLPDEQAPGSPLGTYLNILARTARYDAIGALDPSFSRRDALAGEWWLLQPVSPRLVHEEVGARVGLELCGFLPPQHVDVEGRVVMVCYPRRSMTDKERVEQIAETKWINGFDRVIWTPGQGPLADEDFDLLEELEGVTEHSYGPYKHSTELPPFPPPSKYGPDGGEHARAVAQAVMEALDAPEDPNAEAVPASLELTPEAQREAVAKAKDLGRVTRDEAHAATEVLLDFATHNDQPPKVEQPALLLDMIRRRVEMCVPERVASVLLRNLGDVATMHDLRAWCLQGIWAVGKSDREEPGA